jgi:hypothetical protein
MSEGQRHQMGSCEKGATSGQHIPQLSADRYQLLEDRCHTTTTRHQDLILTIRRNLILCPHRLSWDHRLLRLRRCQNVKSEQPTNIMTAAITTLSSIILGMGDLILKGLPVDRLVSDTNCLTIYKLSLLACDMTLQAIPHEQSSTLMQTPVAWEEIQLCCTPTIVW